jgi:maleamate amidohydrolase
MQKSVVEQYEALAADFRSRGLGGKVGFGSSPALIAVDFSQAFTTPGSPMGGDFTHEIELTRALVAAGQHFDMPTVYSVPRFDHSLKDAGPWFKKIPGCEILAGGTHWVEVDERLAADPGIVMYKKYPSVFFGTDLASILIARGVDTVLITGITTSGCVRATAVDACSLGFRTIVVRDACADRAELPHIATLFDLEMKYADVVSQSEALAYLETVGTGRDVAPASDHG